MFDLVRRIGKVERLDLCLYSRGGAVEVPWRIISMLRGYCDHLGVLIPYRAHSAATLIALGCDEIVLGPKAELGPIDPALSISNDKSTEVKEQIRVEDVMSFIGFIKEVAGLGDQDAIAANVRVLTETLSPWVLGSIYRTHTHIRMVARKMLACHAKRVDEQAAKLVIETLAEKIYSHGHAIGRAEAKEIGLPVAETDDKLDDLLWQLLEEYESQLELRRPLYPNSALSSDVDEINLPTTIASLETSEIGHEFRGMLKFKRVRQAPTQINLNMNLNVTLPPNVDPKTLPKDLQDAISQMIQQVKSDAPKWVKEQTRKQSPEIRVEIRLEDAYWQEVP